MSSNDNNNTNNNNNNNNEPRLVLFLRTCIDSRYSQPVAARQQASSTLWKARWSRPSATWPALSHGNSLGRKNTPAAKARLPQHKLKATSKVLVIASRANMTLSRGLSLVTRASNWVVSLSERLADNRRDKLTQLYLGNARHDKGVAQQKANEPSWTTRAHLQIYMQLFQYAILWNNNVARKHDNNILYISKKKISTGLHLV